MQEIKLKKFGDELVYCPDICVYEGESIKLNPDEIDFQYSKALLYVNGLFLGAVNGSVGVHSSKLIKGLNNIEFHYYDNKNKLISKLKCSLYKRPSVRGVDSVEEEFTILNNSISKLAADIELLKAWQKEIDLERSGYYNE